MLVGKVGWVQFQTLLCISLHVYTTFIYHLSGINVGSEKGKETNKETDRQTHHSQKSTKRKTVLTTNTRAKNTRSRNAAVM